MCRAADAQIQLSPIAQCWISVSEVLGTWIQKSHLTGTSPLLDTDMKINSDMSCSSKSRKQHRKTANKGITLHFRSHHPASTKRAVAYVDSIVPPSTALRIMFTATMSSNDKQEEIRQLPEDLFCERYLRYSPKAKWPRLPMIGESPTCSNSRDRKDDTGANAMQASQMPNHN